MKKITLLVAVSAVLACCLVLAGCGCACDSATESTTTSSTLEGDTATSTTVLAQIDQELIGIWLPLDTGNDAVLEFTVDGRMLILNEDPEAEPVETPYKVEDGMIVLVNGMGVDDLMVPYTIMDDVLSITDAESGIVETYERQPAAP